MSLTQPDAMAQSHTAQKSSDSPGRESATSAGSCPSGIGGGRPPLGGSTASSLANENGVSQPNPGPRLFNINMDSVARRMRLEGRSGSTPGSARAPSAGGGKAITDSAILTAVRKQMEALEDKLTAQISRMQQQSDRLRDVALSRVDSKMGTIEALQPKLDRRLAELSGNYKGLSDEMQAQIRRFDQMDQRLWEWRHQLEEEVRGKLSDQEQKLQQLTSKMRVSTDTNDDSMKRVTKRVVRLEGLIEDRVIGIDQVNQGLHDLHDRLLDIEEHRQAEAANRQLDSPPRETFVTDATRTADAHSMVAIETRLGDACQKHELLQQQLHDYLACVEAQEERMRALQTRLEAKEEQYRGLSDRVERADWEGRFKLVQTQLQELGHSKRDHSEQVEMLSKKVAAMEQLVEDSVERDRQHTEPLPSSAVAEQTLGDVLPTAIDTNDALSMEVKDCIQRLSDLELKVETMSVEVHVQSPDQQLAPRVASLVEHLKDVAPKVIEQERCIKELHERVGQLDVQGRFQGEQRSDASATLISDIIGLKRQVEQLEVKVEGMSADVGAAKDCGGPVG